ETSCRRMMPGIVPMNYGRVLAGVALRWVARHVRHPPSLDPGGGEDPPDAVAMDEPLMARDALRHIARAHYLPRPARTEDLLDRLRLHRPRPDHRDQRRGRPDAAAAPADGGRLLRRGDGGGRRARCPRPHPHHAE